MEHFKEFNLSHFFRLSSQFLFFFRFNLTFYPEPVRQEGPAPAGRPVPGKKKAAQQGQLCGSFENIQQVDLSHSLRPA